MTEKVSRFRAVSWLIHTASFEYLYDELEDAERVDVNKLILDGEIDKLKKFVSSKRVLGEKSIQQLRHDAKRLRLPNWSRLSKCELIVEIEKCKKK